MVSNYWNFNICSYNVQKKEKHETAISKHYEINKKIKK